MEEGDRIGDGWLGRSKDRQPMSLSRPVKRIPARSILLSCGPVSQQEAGTRLKEDEFQQPVASRGAGCN